MPSNKKSQKKSEENFGGDIRSFFSKTRNKEVKEQNRQPTARHQLFDTSSPPPQAAATVPHKNNTNVLKINEATTQADTSNTLESHASLEVPAATAAAAGDQEGDRKLPAALALQNRKQQEKEVIKLDDSDDNDCDDTVEMPSSEAKPKVHPGAAGAIEIFMTPTKRNHAKISDQDKKQSPKPSTSVNTVTPSILPPSRTAASGTSESSASKKIKPSHNLKASFKVHPGAAVFFSTPTKRKQTEISVQDKMPSPKPLAGINTVTPRPGVPPPRKTAASGTLKRPAFEKKDPPL
jgi:hypothetical protein